MLSWRCPGIRVLLLRQTMQSLRESVLATLEDKVWAPIMNGARHPAQHGTALRSNRRDYLYPNGTHWVIGGLEDPGWTFSMEYDAVLAFEAWQISRDSIEKLYRANRNHVLCRYAPWNQKLAELVGRDWNDPRWLSWHGDRKKGWGCWQQIVLDTNPAGEFNPVNQLAAPIGGGELEDMKQARAPSRRVFPGTKERPFTRILSRHEDNPACTQEDLDNLAALTGPRRANLYLGLWQSAEGQIWPTFDPTVHMLSARIEYEGERDPNAKTDTRVKFLRFLGDRGEHLPERVEIKWTFASQDLGYVNAGCIDVWAVDFDERIYRVVEIYQREMLDDWWTDRLVELWEEFDLYEAVLDCEDRERIVKVNDRLAKKGGSPIARGVDKSVRRANRARFVPTSLDLVRELLDPKQKGGPKIYWLRDALRSGPDPYNPAIQLPKRCRVSTEKHKPCCSEEEIPGFTFRPHEDGKPDDEEPDPAVPQDGCASVRYAAVYKWLMDPKGPRVAPRFAPGTVGARLGHEAVLAKAAKARR